MSYRELSVYNSDDQATNYQMMDASNQRLQVTNPSTKKLPSGVSVSSNLAPNDEYDVAALNVYRNSTTANLRKKRPKEAYTHHYGTTTTYLLKETLPKANLSATSSYLTSLPRSNFTNKQSLATNSTIRVLNVPLLAILNQAKSLPTSKKIALDFLIMETKSSLFVER